MAEHRLTPKPKLCVKCGEAQPDSQDWFGEAVRLRVTNEALVKALETAQQALYNLAGPTLRDGRTPATLCWNRFDLQNKACTCTSCVIAAALAQAKGASND
jgi:hypothetical protein